MIRLTDRLDVTIDVDRDVKRQNKPTKKKKKVSHHDLNSAFCNCSTMNVVKRLKNNI